MKLSLRPICVTALLILLFAALQVHAAEEGGNAAAERATQLFKWVNFAIVAGLLGWVFLKLTPPIFRKNAEAIHAAVTSAESLKAEADRQVAEADRRLARLAEETAELHAASEREMLAAAERIRAFTRSEVEKVHLAAKAEIEAAERAARIELKVRAADLAVRGAESLLVKQLTPQAQESLVTSFMKSLEGRPN
jgi:F-type H+-transporting ATPase subunit b